MKYFGTFIGIFLTFQCAVTAEAEQLYYCSFAKGGWNPDEWILVKSARWDHFGGWIQKDSHIENETPENAQPNELIEKYASETYTSMVLKRKVSGNISVISTMEFDDRMGGGTPGYWLLGKVFAMGYLKALAESVEKTGY